MSRLSLLSFLLLLQACALFKNTKTDLSSASLRLEKEVVLVETAKQHSEITEKLLLWQQTANGQTHRVVIYPIGVFSFSAEKGFEGAATKLLIQQTDFNTAATVLQNNTQQQSARTQNKVLVDKSLQEEKIKQKVKSTKPSWALLGYLGFLLLLLVLWWAWRWLPKK